MIKAIIFDYYGVLSSDKYWLYTGENKNGMGRFHNLSDKVNIGAMTWVSFIDEVAQELHQTPQTIKAMYAKERIVDVKLLDCIKQLHARYKTALLTNASYEYLEPVIAKLRLHKLFDEIVISSRLGMIKPDPQIFEYTLNKLKVGLDEAVFIDDRTINVDAAQRLGIKSILYESLAQMCRELEGFTRVPRHQSWRLTVYSVLDQ